MNFPCASDGFGYAAVPLAVVITYAARYATFALFLSYGIGTGSVIALIAWGTADVAVI